MQLCWLDRGMVVGVGYWMLTFSIKSKTFFNKTRVGLDTMNHRTEMGSILNFKSLKWKLIWNIGNMLKCPWYLLWFQMTRGRPAFEASLKSLLSHHDHMEIPHIELPTEFLWRSFLLMLSCFICRRKAILLAKKMQCICLTLTKWMGEFWHFINLTKVSSTAHWLSIINSPTPYFLYCSKGMLFCKIPWRMCNYVKLAIWSEFTFRHAR